MSQRRKVLLVNSITSEVVRTAEKLNVSLIAHEEDIDGPFKTNIPLQQVYLAMDDALVFRWLKELVDKAREYYSNNRDDLILPFLKVGLKEKAVSNFFYGYIADILKNDYRLVLLGETFFPNDERLYLFREPGIATSFVREGEVLRLRKFYEWRYIKNVFAVPICLLLWLFPKSKKKMKASLVLEPYHNHYFQNDEFHHINRVLNNNPENIVYYIRNTVNEISIELKKRGKKIITRKDLRLDFSTFRTGMEDYFRCVFYCLKLKKVPLSLKIGWFHFLFELYRYKALLKTCDFRYLFKIRGDLYLGATLLRELMNSRKIKTISYSHATYFFPEYFFVNVDFDYYGYSGPCELETYEGYWPANSINYIHSGQMSCEAPNNVKSWEDIYIKDTEEREGNFAVGIFPTSIDKHENPNTKEIYEDFIKVAFKCAAKYTKDRIIFKDKYGLKSVRGDKPKSDNIDFSQKSVDDCIKKYGINPVTTYTNTKHDKWKNISAVDVYGLIDIGLTFAYSTCPFELLALQKKVLVYFPFKSVRHPFSKHAPLLVAQDINTFENNFEILVNMSGNEYKSYITNTIDYCGKKSNGHMVQDLFKQIDSCLAGEIN